MSVAPRFPEIDRPGSAVVLDGGMSNALEDLGYDLSDRLWTARLLRDSPDAVAEVHRRYYRAGAQVATTATYQASVQGFVAQGFSRDEAAALVVRGVGLARRVRDELADDGVERWVAASVGPYGAYLADGSEYRGRYGLSRAQLRDFHGPRLELLASAGPDVLAVETIPDIDEAEVLVGLLDDVGLPAWFSFSSREGRTAAGQPLREALAVASAVSCVVAVGVNCLPSGEVLRAVRTVREVTDKSAVVYPNGGGRWDPALRTWIGEPGLDPALARKWVAGGAALVGGCCRVGPADIARLTTALDAL
ncbi:MAG TPA: homocysteine S-methyltransferase [Lapillicoccus sp.]